MDRSIEKTLLLADELSGVPTLKEMPRRTLADKGIDGPTAAHVIEELHTPLNLAYTTFTSGTTAFQNIVGVTHTELPGRIEASEAVLDRLRLDRGDRLIVTYPPLVNVFTKDALERRGLEWSFLERSSRESLLSQLLHLRPRAVIGESAFLRAAMEDAKRLNLCGDMPQGLLLISTGTPLDADLVEIAREVADAEVHDLYGCQEMGWIALDGFPVRRDVVYTPVQDGNERYLHEVIVGGLSVGDCFPVSEGGHVCGLRGSLITYRGSRSQSQMMTVLKETTLHSAETAARVVRTILRIKGKIAYVARNLRTNAPNTVLEVVPLGCPDASGRRIEGPVQTAFFDEIARAQLDYQQMCKEDPAWLKRR